VSRWNLRPEVMGELNLPAKVIIKDTTLREGEETPNVAMTLEDKMAIARMLSEMGIPEADAGYVGAVEREREFVWKVKSEGLRLKLAAHARALIPDFKKEIDTVAEAGVEIIQLVLHPVPAEGFEKKDYSARIGEAVRHAKERGLFVTLLPGIIPGSGGRRGRSDLPRRNGLLTRDRLQKFGEMDQDFLPRSASGSPCT